MVYSTDANKWRAYQFSDPFAAGSFVVCNKITSKFCRPDCDGHPITELRSEIKFVDSPGDAISLGFAACEACEPMSVPKIDVNLLVKTVKEINARIGFVPPLLDDDEDKVTETIKENIIGNNSHSRRMSVPANTFSNKEDGAAKAATFAVSKNDSEHYRLIDLACRHLALAAAHSIFGSSSDVASPRADDSPGSSQKKKGTRKRRGGVLGFKELATKSKLSAWHFHRVFKSIIGLTPKTYGDMCWEYLEKERDSLDGKGPSNLTPAVPSVKFNSGSFTSNLPSEGTTEIKTEEPYMTPPQTAVVMSPGSGQKRPRHQDNEEHSPKKRLAPAHSRQMSPFTDLRLDDDGLQFGLSARATSVPNLTVYNSQDTLFGHSKDLELMTLADPDRLLVPVQDQLLGLPEGQPGLNNGGFFPSPSDNISPVPDSNEISPMSLHSDIPVSMFNPQASQITGFTVGGDPFYSEPEMFATGDLADSYALKNDYLPELGFNESLFAGVVPDMVATAEY